MGSFTPTWALPATLLPLLLYVFGVDALSYNGLAQTPQMGWDNWNAFACSVSDPLITETSKLVVQLGLRDLGYEYIILDDCWSAGRNASNNDTLVPDPVKFPRGMKAVADDVHGLGLKWGMYSSAGLYTCALYPGSLGRETTDAQTFASWGVDYLKYDNCNNQGQAGTQHLSYLRYKVMSDALNATGRPILYSLCNWGEDLPWNWGGQISNSWRISGDVYDSFDRPDPRCPCEGSDAGNCYLPGNHCSVLNILEKAASVMFYGQHSGAWNDLDMLVVGIGGMTDEEYVAHFSMWSALKSPLIMGNDFSKITPASYSILSNAAVIAVNQDPMGTNAVRRWTYPVNNTDTYGQGSIQMWSGALNSTTGGKWNDYVVLLLNGGNASRAMTADLQDVFIDTGTGGTAPELNVAWEVRDLWADRLNETTAEAILKAANVTVTQEMRGNGTVGVFGNETSVLYNATRQSYAEGIAKADPALLGKVSTTVPPSGTITTSVSRHGVAMLRLRAVETRSSRRDEL